MKDKIAGRLLIISFMAAFTAAFAGKVEWFIYSLALAAVLTGCGLIKENTVAGGAFLITGCMAGFNTYFYFHPNSIITAGIITVYSVPVTVIVICLFISSCFLWYGFIKRHKNLKRCNQKVTGTVIDLKSNDRFVKRGNRNTVRTFYKETFYYTVDGNDYKCEAAMWKTSGYYKKLEKADIRYNPENPEDVVLPRKHETTVFLVLVTAVCFTCTFVFSFLWFKSHIL